MPIGLILAAIAFPLLELAVLIKVGQSIGVWWTLLLLAAACIGGGLIINHQGFAALRRGLEASRRERPLIEPVLDSMLLILAGVLLLIPGFITDALALALLIPPLRRGLGRWALSRLLAGAEVHVETRGMEDGPGRPRAGETSRAPDGGLVIEGEWTRVEDTAPPSRKPAPDRERDADRGRGPGRHPE